jgi:hypothetical protein
MLIIPEIANKKHTSATGFLRAEQNLQKQKIFPALFLYPVIPELFSSLAGPRPFRNRLRSNAPVQTRSSGKGPLQESSRARQ